MEIINGTPHPITLFREEDAVLDTASRKLILKEGAEPIKVIGAGVPLNAKTGNLPYVGDIPYFRGAVIFTEVDPLPPGDGVVVVSNLYRAALVELGYSTERVATVGGAVYPSKDSPRPVGCIYLARG